jgi:CRP/FNR family transcriptional regulator, nitrogen fixation regulation protein
VIVRWKAQLGGFALINLDRALLTATKLGTIEFDYGPDETIYEHGDRAQFVYVVDEGALARLRVRSGRRSITEFLLPGESFGFEIDRNHRDTVQTLTPTKLFAAPREALLNAAASDRKFTDLLLNDVVGQTMVAELHGHCLRTMDAAERVAQFLLEMKRRLSISGKIDLPMSRRHIADYLGVRLETVSRVLNVLQEEDIVQFLDVRQRQIVIRDKRRLQRLASDASDFEYWQKRNGESRRQRARSRLQPVEVNH